MNNDIDEDLCRRCGRCCYEKLEFAGAVYYTPTPCEWLDLQTRLCTVYPDRQKVRPGCVKLTKKLIRQGLLPADCPYVAKIEHYNAPHPWPETEEEEEGR